MSTVIRVTITKNGKDVSDACQMENGKGNPFGWSSYDLWHHSRRIGSVYCGALKLDEEAISQGYTVTVTEEEGVAP